MRTPDFPYWSAMAEAKLMSAALATPAVVSQGVGLSPSLPTTRTTLPLPCSLMRGSMDLQARTYPMNFRFRLLNHSSSVKLSRRPPGELPAQVTRMSILPKELTVSSTARSTSSGLLMSPAIGIIFWPVASANSCAAFSSASLPRAVTTTVHPSSASTRAHSLPMPLLAPVIKATESSSSRFIRSSSSFRFSRSDRNNYRGLSGLTLLPGHPHQLVLQHLPHLVARTLVDHKEPLRALVGAEVLTSVGREIPFVHSSVPGRNDESDDLFSPPLRRDTNDRRPFDSCVIFQDELDLPGINVQPSRDDHLLQTSRYRQVSVFRVRLAHVTGPEPTPRIEGLFGGIRKVPVA